MPWRLIKEHFEQIRESLSEREDWRMGTRKNLRPGTKGKIGNTAFEVGSGNVFADPGLSNPDERLAKARLAMEINALIQRMADAG